MIKSTQLRQSLRRLLLPMRPATEEQCLCVLQSFFSNLEVDEDDYLDWISLNLGEWEDLGRPGVVLLNLFEIVLKVADASMGPRLAESWVKICSKLHSEHFLTHNEIRFFLSHSFLIIDLANNDRLSAAQISRLLSEKDKRVRFSRQCVFDFLEALNIAPGISEEQVRDILEVDSLDELRYFADADIASAADIVGDEASKLGFPCDLGLCLRNFSMDNNIIKYMPYIQILHYQCIIAEYFDHAVADLYEFKPRGKAVRFLLSRYPVHIVGADNPYLNNAKSVESITKSWVRSKKVAERFGAGLLFEILSSLEAMGFTARREVCWLIRLWISRAVKLNLNQGDSLPQNLCVADWKKFLRHVAKENSKTYGIFEQRVVDAIASSFHPERDGWRSRGLGAPVNATNISQRKLGDCDFQHTIDLSITAYEAHGGKLSLSYFDEHKRSMKKALRDRAEELKGVADIDCWQISVHYIAHNVEALEEGELDVSGVRVKFKSSTYSAFVEKYIQDEIDPSHLDALILKPIRDARTPNEVRREFLKVISS